MNIFRKWNWFEWGARTCKPSPVKSWGLETTPSATFHSKDVTNFSNFRWCFLLRRIPNLVRYFELKGRRSWRFQPSWLYNPRSIKIELHERPCNILESHHSISGEKGKRNRTRASSSVLLGLAQWGQNLC